MSNNNKRDSRVRISKKEYDDLKDDSEFLDILFAHGLENWEGYELAVADFDE